jgi:TfoX/Sxy family transcriptional regulator of competence genes
LTSEGKEARLGIMPYSEDLENRIQAVVGDGPGFERKAMFGGICHLLWGNMFCGVYRDHLILRLGEPAAAEALKQPGVRPFDITGRPMKGWAMVEPDAIRKDDVLENWLARALRFAESLPPKRK